MDKPPVEQLREGRRALGLEDLPDGLDEALWAYATTLLRWNERVNLTAITRFSEVVEKHLLDALAVLPEVRGAATLLDVGTGAGVPGIPLALALPKLKATLVDAVNKKVLFVKNAAAQAGLGGRVAGRHIHLAGAPETEGLERAEVVISRAFTDVEAWVMLAKNYLAPEGRVVAMLGQTPTDEVLRAAGEKAGLRLVSVRRYALPFTKAPRGVAVFAR